MRISMDFTSFGFKNAKTKRFEEIMVWGFYLFCFEIEVHVVTNRSSQLEKKKSKFCLRQIFFTNFLKNLIFQDF